MSEFQKLVAAVAASGDVKFLIDHPELAEYAKLSTFDSTLYNIVDNHVSKYGKVPAKDVVVEEWGEALPEATEPPLYYLGRLRTSHIQKMLSTAASEAQSHMKNNPEQSLAIMRKAVMDLDANQQAASTMDFRDSGERVMKWLSSKWSGNYISMGYPSFDKNSGGLMPGDFISLSGFTGAGKTMVLLTRAFHFWETHHRPVLFISGEMDLNAIIERAAAYYSKVPADYLKHGLFPNIATKIDYKQKLIDRLKEAEKAGVPLIFIEANLAMAEKDILRLCQQYHAAILCVDGAAILGGAGYGRRWEQIASMATFLKQAICQGLGIPVIASYQFTNEARREFKKKHGMPSLADIAGSQEIANLSTVCLGMTQEKTPETTHRRQIDILKGRNGESGNFYINWNWTTMNFDEYIEPTADDSDDLDDLEIA
jgi:replicative DNA helicase